MSKGLICDQCGSCLAVNDHGDSDTGEESGWIEVRTTFGRYDLCTRACASALLDSADFVAAVEAGQEAIAQIVRVLNDDDESSDT